MSRRPGTARLVAAVLCLAVAAAGCGGVAGPEGDADPTEDVVSGVATNPAIAAMLPPDVRAAGRITVATSAKGSPPIRYYSEDDPDTLIGVEIDLQKAVGRVLGVRMDSREATFDEILPAIRSGRFQIGQGNFGVTEERKKLVDFVTYYRDGFGFLVRASRPQAPIREPADLCGLRIGTTAGTSFEQVLDRKQGDCAARGAPPYQVSVFRSTADCLLGLSQNKMDIMVSSAVFLRYAAERQRGRLTYVSEIYQEKVGFMLDHDSPLTPAVHRAVQQLIDDGSYQKIMAKWGLESAAVRTSEVNPPGLE